MKTPRVSVILPSYNGSRFLSRAVMSVQAQDFTDWELIIVDDGSIDATLEIAQECARADTRIRVVSHEKNQGIQKSLNRGLREARGEYIARIDDDDLWLSPLKLSRQVAFFDTHPDYVLLGTGIVVFNEDAREIMRYLAPASDAAIRSRMLLKNCFVHSSVMFRKDIAVRCGGYSEDTAILHVEDYNLWLKLGTVGKMHNLPSYDTGFTARQGGLSATNKRAQLYRTLDLIAKYRQEYPYYHTARMAVWIKIFVYAFFGMLPSAAQRCIFTYYKRW